MCNSKGTTHISKIHTYNIRDERNSLDNVSNFSFEQFKMDQSLKGNFSMHCANVPLSRPWIPLTVTLLIGFELEKMSSFSGIRLRTSRKTMSDINGILSRSNSDNFLSSVELINSTIF